MRRKPSLTNAEKKGKYFILTIGKGGSAMARSGVVMIHWMSAVLAIYISISQISILDGNVL